MPLTLAAAEPLDSIFRSVNTYPHLAPDSIGGNPENTSDAELAARAREILDGLYAAELRRTHDLFEQRRAQGRGLVDIGDVARAATYGAVDTVLVDIDEVVPGSVDDETGAVTLADAPSADRYGVVDEIARRVVARRRHGPGRASRGRPQHDWGRGDPPLSDLSTQGQHPGRRRAGRGAVQLPPAQRRRQRVEDGGALVGRAAADQQQVGARTRGHQPPLLQRSVAPQRAGSQRVGDRDPPKPQAASELSSGSRWPTAPPAGRGSSAGYTAHELITSLTPAAIAAR